MYSGVVSQIKGNFSIFWLLLNSFGLLNWFHWCFAIKRWKFKMTNFNGVTKNPQNNASIVSIYCLYVLSDDNLTLKWRIQNGHIRRDRKIKMVSQSGMSKEKVKGGVGVATSVDTRFKTLSRLNKILLPTSPFLNYLTIFGIFSVNEAPLHNITLNARYFNTCKLTRKYHSHVSFPTPKFYRIHYPENCNYVS